jgi:hypothetical protein
MNFIGKYIFTMPTPSGERESTFFLRNYYDGSLHGTLLSSHGGVDLARDIVAEGNRLSFAAQAGPAKISFTFEIAEDGSFTGKALVTQSDGKQIVSDVKGRKSEITPEDDGAHKIEMKGKALILYSTITKNTEKVANWFRETFEHYCMKTTMIRVTNNINWENYRGQLYFEDYDVVCMGSPIIGGSPMKCMLKHFSAGAASSLEDRVTKNFETGLGFNAGGAGGFAPGAVRDGSEGPMALDGPPPGLLPGPGGPDGPPPMRESVWHRPGMEIMPYPGGPLKQEGYKPLGIVFTTYGGGFAGSDECLPVLALLKLYLEQLGAKVIGKFACCGREFGPAGLDDGVTPLQVKDPPVSYKDADGNYHAGSFFFHCHANSKPGPREEAKAKAFIADIVEDHFYTSDGKRRNLSSEYISIS